MGTPIELHDTLVLKRGTGFPSNLEAGRTYDFEVQERRLYNLAPSRVFLVEEVDGKWNFVGHALVARQWVDTTTDRTLGTFTVARVHPRDYARMANAFEAPEGLGYVEVATSAGVGSAHPEPDGRDATR